MSKIPLWATPERQTALVRFFTQSRGFCVFGHKQCQNPDHHYSQYIEYLITEWKQDDREQRSAELKAEFEALHRTNWRKYPLRGRFSGVSMDIFHDNSPIFYLEGQTISGVTLKPFVKVRIASSYIRLYVDLGGILRQVSKSKRRKAVRYGKPLPELITRQINAVVLEAYRDYLEN